MSLEIRHHYNRVSEQVLFHLQCLTQKHWDIQEVLTNWAEIVQGLPLQHNSGEGVENLLVLKYTQLIQ